MTVRMLKPKQRRHAPAAQRAQAAIVDEAPLPRKKLSASDDCAEIQRSLTLYTSPSPLAATSITQDQAHSFDYFRTVTLLDLSGLHERRLWSEVVMPASVTEPTIFHAAIALSMLHETLACPGPVNKIKVLKQYNLAVVELANRLSNLEDYEVCKVALITCLVFTIIESLLQSPTAARKQLEYGVQLLQNWKPNRIKADPIRSPPLLLKDGSPGPVATTDDDELVEKMARMDLITASFTGCEQLFKRELSLPASFTSIAHAYHYLSFQNNAVFAFLDHKAYQNADLREINEEIYYEREAKRTQLKNRHHTWNVLFTDLIASLTLKEQDKRKVCNSQLYSYMFNTIIHVGHTGEMAYDAHLADFEEIITLGRRMLSLYGPRGMPMLSLDSIFTTAMVFTVLKCRDPVVRRKALEVLRSAPAHNSFLHSTMMANYCAEAIDLEERGLGQVTCAQDVPVTARFIAIHQKEAADLKTAVITAIKLLSDNRQVVEHHTVALQVL